MIGVVDALKHTKNIVVKQLYATMRLMKMSKAAFSFEFSLMISLSHIPFLLDFFSTSSSSNCVKRAVSRNFD